MTEVYVASGFSKEGQGGNKAGVVLDRPDLMNAQKMAIAKELGYSETAFIGTSNGADYQFEYFTPTEEVALCGHATIAAFAIMKGLGILEKTHYTIETKAGILNVELAEDGQVFMEQNCPTYYEKVNSSLFKDCLEKQFIEEKLPIQIISTGLKDIILPIQSALQLSLLEPKFDSISKLSEQLGVVGIHAFALSHTGAYDAICRNFAPLYGIDEESATGTSNCALAGYLFKYVEKKQQYIFEQGCNLEQPSRMTVKLNYHEDIIDAIYIGGYGYLVEKKKLSI